MTSTLKKAAAAGVFTVASLALAPSSFAMTEGECTAAWTAADVNKDGVISVTEGARYHAAVRVAGKTPADGRLTQSEFLADCKAGVFDMRKNDVGAPLKGANSFTETQAHDRAMAFGLSDVAGLKKDSDGIWRGTAKHQGKAVNVAIDFKGNVVAN